MRAHPFCRDSALANAGSLVAIDVAAAHRISAAALTRLAAVWSVGDDTPCVASSSRVSTRPPGPQMGVSSGMQNGPSGRGVATQRDYQSRSGSAKTLSSLCAYQLSSAHTGAAAVDVAAAGIPEGTKTSSGPGSANASRVSTTSPAMPSAGSDSISA